MDAIDALCEEDCPVPVSAPAWLLGELGKPLSGAPSFNIYREGWLIRLTLLVENSKFVEMLKGDRKGKVPLFISTRKNSAGNARFTLTLTSCSSIRACGTEVVTYEAQACSGTGDRFPCVFCLEDFCKVFNQVIPDKIYVSTW